MIPLPSGDFMEDDSVDAVTGEIVDDTAEEELHDKTGLLVLEMAIIRNNIDSYPDVHTVEDIFNTMLVQHRNQTDFRFAEVVRELLDYSEEEEETITDEELIKKDMYKEMFVTIPTKGLYARIDLDSEDYQLVHQIAFLKADHYIPGKSDGMKIIPCLGKKVKRSEFEGNGITPAYLVTCNAIKAHEDIDELKKFFTLRKEFTTDPFVCGDYLYSIKGGILGQHGYLNAENVEHLKKGA